MELSDPFLTDVLGQAPQLYVSMLSSKGEPVVTPELYAVAADRLWCLTARSTAKGKSINDGDTLGVAVLAPSRSAVLQCRAQRFDITRPAELIAKLRDLGEAAAGVTTFLARNGVEMMGAARDAVLGRLGFPPDMRVLLGLDPTAAKVAPSEGGDRVVLGWRAGNSPLALPATWSAEDGVARVDTELFDGFGGDDAGPATVCFDQWSGLGPSGKQGGVLHGTGTTSRDGDAVTVVIDVDRITTWDGVEVSTTPT